MGGTGVIDRFLEVFTSYIDSGFGLLGSEVGFLATTLYWASSWIGNNAIAVAAFGYLVTLLIGQRLLPLGQQLPVGSARCVPLARRGFLKGRKVHGFQSFCISRFR